MIVKSDLFIDLEGYNLCKFTETCLREFACVKELNLRFTALSNDEYLVIIV